jgi:hypothetical protein
MTTLGYVNVETCHTRTVFSRVIATEMKSNQNTACGQIYMYALDATELFNKTRLRLSDKKSNRSEG